MKHRYFTIMTCSFLLTCCQNNPAAPVSEPAPDNTREVLRVKGRFLYNPLGEKVILRGIEDFTDNSIDEIAKTGANAYRIAYGIDAAVLERVLYKAVAEHNMVVSIISSGSEYMNAAWWGDPEIKAVLKDYESHLLILAHGEGTYDGWYGYGAGPTQRWLRETKDVIRKIRSYGYTCPLEIYANTWGQNLGLLLDYGREVIESDPEKNIILGCQMYTPNVFANLKPNDITIEQAMQLIVKSGLPIQLGACPFTGADCRPMSNAPVDGWYRVWKGTYENEIGCFYWCWYGSPSWLPACDGLSRDGRYGNWTAYGEEICGSGRYSLSRTAKMSSHVLANWPPVITAPIQNIVLKSATTEVTDYINVKRIFTDHEDGTNLTCSVGRITRPDLAKATLDENGNLDLSIPEGSLGTSRIEIIAEDSGRKKKSAWFSVVVYEPGKGNLALFRNAASSTVDSGMAAGYAFDGLEDTRWGSAWTDDQWIAVDLGAQATIDRVNLLWETAYASSYEIQVSSDNQNWKTVFAQKKSAGGRDEITFTPVSARYVKMRGIARATPYGYSLWECEVYGK